MAYYCTEPPESVPGTMEGKRKQIRKNLRIREVEPMNISEEDYKENQREARKFYVPHEMMLSIIKFVFLLPGLIALRFILGLD